MVKVLRSLVGAPLEPHIVGFAEELLGRGYTRTSAEQHVCFLAHLDRWMQAEGIGLEGLSGLVTDRYLAQHRAAGYVASPATNEQAAMVAVSASSGRTA
jgi:hypothetical protein